jgi:hypothetical protein
MNGRFDETGIAEDSNQDKSLLIKKKSSRLEHLPSDKNTPVQRGETKLHTTPVSRGEGRGVRIQANGNQPS